MNTLDLRPEALLPHDHPMILIDGILDFGKSYTESIVTPDPDSPFADKEGNVPAWIGMEYMAQTIGAYAGIRAQLAGKPVKVGFLLGTRAYDIDICVFECRQFYCIAVHMTYEDDGLSAFECTIRHYSPESDAQNKADVIARATINTFQPDNIDEFLT